MNKLTRQEFFALFDESVHDKIIESVKRYQATHLICFQNQMFDSSQFGKRTACVIGSNCTYKTLQDAEKSWLNDLPSQRQHPYAYWEVNVADLKTWRGK